MSFLAPGALALAALLPAIVLLYFLKLKRRDQPVSSTYLWQQAIQDLRVNSPFQRLRKNLLLWLQLALLALLVLGRSRPAVDATETEGVRYICLIDTSASMSATDERPSRLAVAKGQARRLIGDLSRGDEMMLITFDSKPSVAVPFTRDKAALRAAVNRIEAHPASSDFVQALDLVRALVQDQTDVRLHLLTDGAFETGDLTNAPPVKLSYVRVGRPADNVGFTALDARRSLEAWDRPQVFAGVRNCGDAAVSARIDLYLDGALFDARVVRVPAGENAAAVFADPKLKEGVVRVVLNHDDALAADNEAFLILEEPRQVNALVVSPGNQFLELAVEHDPFCAPTFLPPAAFDDGLKAGTVTPSDYDLVILDRHSPNVLPPGTYLFLGALPHLDEFKAKGEAKQPVIIDWDRAHPLTRYVNFGSLFLGKALRFEGPASAHTLVETNEGPLVQWWATGSHRILVAGFDMFESRWPLRVGFPVFIANAVRYMGGVESLGETARVQPGKAISALAPANTADVRVTYPNGAQATVQPQGGRVTFGDTYACGPYRFDFGSDRSDTYVVNLLDARESDLTPRDEIQWQAETVAGTRRALKENREIWPWLALAALSVLMVEWFIYNRRVYI